MKKHRFSKLFIGASLLFSLGIAPLTGCSTFFGEDGFVITDVTWENNSDGDVRIVIKTTREEDSDIVLDMPASNGIKDVTAVLNDDGTELTVTIFYSKNANPTIFKIPIAKGKDGKGVSRVEVGTDANGNTTIRFVYTDNTLSELITIPSGKDGNSIKNIAVDETSDPENYILIITFTNDVEPIEIKYKKPKNGISLVSVTYDEAASDSENYVLVLTYSDDYEETIVLPMPKSTIWHHGEKLPEPDIGKNGDYYLNVLSGNVYFKQNGSWTFIFSMDGSGSYIEKIVTFNPGEGTWSNPQLINGAKFHITVKYGDYIPLKQFPEITREGYQFAGWFTGTPDQINAGQFTDLTPVQRDINLYPRWTLL